MVHDEIKAAARRRMTQTGEPYCLARRNVIEEHKRSANWSTSTAFDAKVLQISRMADFNPAKMLADQLADLNPANMVAAQLADFNPAKMLADQLADLNPANMVAAQFTVMGLWDDDE
jgi:hypothetical protein